MCVVAEFAPEDVLPLRGNHEVIFYAGDFPFSVHMDSLRYATFAKSLVCCSCGLVGSVMRLEYSYHQQGHVRPHFNLYALNPDNGTYVLMTKDHIIPVSKGGKDLESNLQTMCSPCNLKKGDKFHATNEDRKGTGLNTRPHSHKEGDSGTQNDTSRFQPYRVHRQVRDSVLVTRE